MTPKIRLFCKFLKPIGTEISRLSVENVLQAPRIKEEIKYSLPQNKQR